MLSVAATRWSVIWRSIRLRTKVAAEPERPWTRVDKWTSSRPDKHWIQVAVRDGAKGPLLIEMMTPRVVARTDKRVTNGGRFGQPRQQTLQVERFERRLGIGPRRNEPQRHHDMDALLLPLADAFVECGPVVSVFAGDRRTRLNLDPADAREIHPPHAHETAELPRQVGLTELATQHKDVIQTKRRVATFFDVALPSATAHRLRHDRRLVGAGPRIGVRQSGEGSEQEDDQGACHERVSV